MFVFFSQLPALQFVSFRATFCKIDRVSMAALFLGEGGNCPVNGTICGENKIEMCSDFLYNINMQVFSFTKKFSHVS
jgi:hypothetical protein